MGALSENEKKGGKTDVDLTTISIGELLKKLTIGQIWKVAASIVAVLIGIATISYRIGAGKWPWK